ncbi:MAG: hypothetical protein MZV70_42840 [Desulfobacterales bacterium]|nr:hypothetical protein [Desulfobacterales bacterium]
MKWRNIGPHRASRTVAAAGHRRQPHTFYMAAVNGGVWKTTDAGRTWVPIFDDQPTGSIGSIAVAPSDPNIVYVGSGEGLHRPDLSTGDGVYKSADAGQTWTRLGLNDAQQIPRIDVDPRNPNRLFVAALGHPYGPNEERGIFRSLDGGKTFQKVLYKDENTGGNDVDIDPVDPNIVYATLWEERQGPWENAVWAGTGGGIFKSTDGGTTWKPLTNGLPPVIQANLAISPADRRRLLRGRRVRRTAGIEREPRDDGHLPQRRRGPVVDAHHDRHEAVRAHRRRRPAGADSPSEARGHGDHGRPPCRGRRPTAARRGRSTRARPAARTTRTAGSTRTTPTSSCSRPTRAPS